MTDVQEPMAVQALHRVDVECDLRIPTRDAAVSLSADVYLPVGVGPAPTLLLAHPYRKDASGVDGDPLSRWFAERGYASAVIDLRGIGSSDGNYREFALVQREDLADAIAWLAGQPWCDGNIGMWGHSYAAWTALTAAAINPGPLKAIIAVEGPTDPERQLIHPDGARSDLRTCYRTLLALINQLSPPVREEGVEGERRWRERLANIEPAFLDIARHGPGDAFWRKLAVDPATIDLPALCIGGWQDFVLESVVGTYEQLAGPKKLLIGPWGHALPHLADVAPVNFPMIALRWWDHWLRRADNGAMDEPQVTLYIPGDEPAFRAFDAWPPSATALKLATTTGLTLTKKRGAGVGAARTIAEYQPDPTIGALRVFSGSTLAGVAPLPDQHDDDMRGVAATSEPLIRDVLVVGRPGIMVTFVREDAPAPFVQRLVASLADVDPQGRSTLVTTRVATLERQTPDVQLVLRPTAWRFRAGHRLRVVLSDSDFPRLTPLTRTSPIPLAGIELTLPTLTETEQTGTAAYPPPVEAASHERVAPGQEVSATFSVTRELVGDRAEVLMTSGSTGNELEIRGAVSRSDPSAALVTGRQSRRLRLASGEEMTIVATVQCAQRSVHGHAEITVDGTTTFSRTWEAPFKAGAGAPDDADRGGDKPHLGTR